MIVSLKNRSLVRVSGKDNFRFLQSQFSNDISKISNNQIQINCYCQHQGKILAVIWVMKKNDSYLLSFPKDLEKVIIEKLNVYKFMSDVNIEEISNNLYQYGVINEANTGVLLKGNLNILITKKKLFSDNVDLWEQQCIKNNLAEIVTSTYEKFIPQTLNLDIDELGVSFSKGCYPGQEVVARMHYLGKPKRRLFYFESKFEAIVGDSINTKESESLKSSGEVLRVVKINNTFHLLGTLEIKHSSAQIFLNNDTEKPLKIIDD